MCYLTESVSFYIKKLVFRLILKQNKKVNLYNQQLYNLILFYVDYKTSTTYKFSIAVMGNTFLTFFMKSFCSVKKNGFSNNYVHKIVFLSIIFKKLCKKKVMNVFFSINAIEILHLIFFLFLKTKILILSTSIYIYKLNKKYV